MDYSALDDKDMAQAALKEIIEIAPRDYWAHAQLLKLLESSQNWEDAYEVASKATSEDWEGAAGAVTTLGQTCRSCHKAHRGKKKDGDKVINFIK